jgi:hypothetical protein
MDLTRRLHYGLYLILVAYVVGIIVVPALREEPFGYTYDPDVGLRVRDFAAIMVMARAMWCGEPRLPDGRRPGYDVDSLLVVNRAWVDPSINNAMPFPYSPTMLFLLGPLCPLPMVWAFAVWSLLNLAFVGWLISRNDCPRILGPIVFLTPTAISCFTLGQSALLATAALVFLGRETFRKPTERGGNVWLMAAVLWALTARPQLAITASVALLAARHWRPVLIAVVLTLFTTALLTPLLGTRWISDYLTLLGHYDRVTAPSAYAWALVPDYMNNLRALLTTAGVPDDWSSKISTAFWLFSLGVVLASAWLRRLPPALVWGTCVMLQLLLCPHVNTYELVLLYAVLVFLLHIDLVSPDFRTKAVWVIPILLCLTTVGEPVEALRRWLLVVGLLAIAGLFISMNVVAFRKSGAALAPPIVAGVADAKDSPG